MNVPAFVAGFAAFVLSMLVVAAPSHAADWSPGMWISEETLKLRTDCPDEGEHWSYVWLVVLDGDVWVRLGSKAAARVDCNKTKPITSVRIANEVFPQVELVEVPEMADRVAAAMADKYWTDVFVRYMDHPYTMKLVPKSEAEPAE
jgi:hypothetical protein